MVSRLVIVAVILFCPRLRCCTHILTFLSPPSSLLPAPALLCFCLSTLTPLPAPQPRSLLPVVSRQPAAPPQPAGCNFISVFPSLQLSEAVMLYDQRSNIILHDWAVRQWIKCLLGLFSVSSVWLPTCACLVQSYQFMGSRITSVTLHTSHSFSYRGASQS